MSDATCRVEDCDEPTTTQGWGADQQSLCRVHFHAWRRTGNPLGDETYAPRPIECEVAGCPKPVVAKGLCSGHYIKKRKYGDPTVSAADFRPTECCVEGCDRKPVARGFCSGHYTAWSKTGDPLGLPEKSIPNRHETRPDGVPVLVITRLDRSQSRCLYDTGDHDLVVAHQWHLVNGYVYRMTRGGRGGSRALSLHRALFDLGPGDPGVVDHISGDRLDCRRRNLRVGDHGLNGENRAVINELGTSRYRGVCRDRGMWKAYTKIAGRMHNIGRYPTEQEAADAVAAYRAERGVNAGYPRKHPWTPAKGA